MVRVLRVGLSLSVTNISFSSSLEWCKWAGVKRIFHWDEDDGSFKCVKVNDPGSEPYETQADNRLAAGRVRNVSLLTSDSV